MVYDGLYIIDIIGYNLAYNRLKPCRKNMKKSQESPTVILVLCFRAMDSLMTHVKLRWVVLGFGGSAAQQIGEIRWTAEFESVPLDGSCWKFSHVSPYDIYIYDTVYVYCMFGSVWDDQCF